MSTNIVSMILKAKIGVFILVTDIKASIEKMWFLSDQATHNYNMKQK